MNLLILSNSYKKFNLESLEYITYGTEVMPPFTLKKILEIFPDVKLLQKYGTTEVGTLRSKSESSDSLWVKIGGEGYKTRIVDGILQIKADSAMLGYLNAENPFTDDGWFVTGDSVEEKNGYYRILGRKSEMINVGGEKVFPAEVENVIFELDFIKDVTVIGEPNALLGNIVCAVVTLKESETDKKSAKKKIKEYCRNNLENYKVPVKIKFTDSQHFSDRYKKSRKSL